jgi:hypothetical protein
VTGPAELVIDRLLLRQWWAADREAFATLHADPVVMQLLPAAEAGAAVKGR